MKIQKKKTKRWNFEGGKSFSTDVDETNAQTYCIPNAFHMNKKKLHGEKRETRVLTPNGFQILPSVA